MKAIRIHQFGGPEVMQIEEIPTPTPDNGEVLVKLAAAGLNYIIDVYQRSGLYPNSLPYTLGWRGRVRLPLRTAVWKGVKPRARFC